MKHKLNKKLLFSLLATTGIVGFSTTLAVACKKEDKKASESKAEEKTTTAQPTETKEEKQAEPKDDNNNDVSLQSETVDELEKLYNDAKAYPNKQKVVKKIRDFINAKITNEKFKKAATKGAAATLKLTLFKNNKDIEKDKEEENFQKFLTAIRKVPVVGKYFKE